MMRPRRETTAIRENDFGKPLRAVLYARCSTKGEAQDPEVQLATLRVWADRRGWTVVSEERDRVSGDPARRVGDPPGLRGALDAIEQRRADVLAVFAADRLVRSPVGLLQLVARVQAIGGHVASLQDGADLDTTSDVGELFLFLRGWWARMELRLIRARIAAGLERARANGVQLGRPRGKADPAEVCRLRSAGRSWKEIANELDCSVSMARRRADEARNSAAPRRESEAETARVSKKLSANAPEHGLFDTPHGPEEES